MGAPYTVAHAVQYEPDRDQLLQLSAAGFDRQRSGGLETGEFSRYYDLQKVGMMYGFAVSPEGDIYLCDCLDYTAQRGYVRHYLKDGTKSSHKVGIYPGQVYFPENQR